MRVSLGKMRQSQGKLSHRANYHRQSKKFTLELQGKTSPLLHKTQRRENVIARVSRQNLVDGVTGYVISFPQYKIIFGQEML